MSTHHYPCWLCASKNTRLIRAGKRSNQVRVDDFRITDAHYGVTADIFRCAECGFQFCPTIENVTLLYEQMEDATYEATRAERGLQAQQTLKLIKKFKRGGTLLDVGAGSGILVEQAKLDSFEAAGIEPSQSLSRTAQSLGLNVITGTLPQLSLQKYFDVVTLIDVIEHVDSPVLMLQEAVHCMKADAICVLVTPDAQSIAARLMGKRWWHYRLAHIGYFDVPTLRTLADRVGLEIVATYRPGWYFPASYLAERLMSYLPPPLRVKPPAWLDKLTIPLNLFDSLMVICRQKRSEPARQS